MWGPNTDDVRRMLILNKARIHETKEAKEKFEGTVCIHLHSLTLKYTFIFYHIDQYSFYFQL